VTGLQAGCAPCNHITLRVSIGIRDGAHRHVRHNPGTVVPNKGYFVWNGGSRRRGTRSFWYQALAARPSRPRHHGEMIKDVSTLTARRLVEFPT
jgi:hypothetical protein